MLIQIGFILLLPASPLQDKGEQKVAVLGADTRAPTKDEGKTYGLPDLKGRYMGQVVLDVATAGPADKAGVRKGDVILKLNDNELYSRDDLEDLVGAVKPGAKVIATVVRERGKEIKIEIRLGERTLSADEAKHPRFPWDFAGPAQLGQAIAQAKKDGKKVLVGLFGAETWWPTTRFESGSLSKVFSDEKVIEASQAYVRLIIRRPHAYQFRSKHKQVPIPGIAILDMDGKFVDKHDLQGDDAAKTLAELLMKLK